MDRNHKKLTVVGLGPGDLSFVTQEALTLLTSGKLILLRTEEHPVVSALKEKGMRYQTYDSFYESSISFDEVYERIVDDLMARSLTEEVIYAVPGNAFVAEKTVSLLQERYGKEQIRWVHGTSFLDAMITVMGIDPVEGLLIVNALDAPLSVDMDQNAIYLQVYDRNVASQLKLDLLEYFDDDDPAIFVQAAGIPDKQIILSTKICELDASNCSYDHLTSIFIPKKIESYRSLNQFKHVVEQLRREGGDPWVQKLTEEDLINDMLSEAYEVVDAIRSKHDDHVMEEIGDLLFSLLLLVVIAEEQGYYNLQDVWASISHKMIRRTPYVFGEEVAHDAVESEAIFYREKAKERRDFWAVERYIPSLMRFQKMIKRVKIYGISRTMAQLSQKNFLETHSLSPQALEDAETFVRMIEERDVRVETARFLVEKMFEEGVSMEIYMQEMADKIANILSLLS